MLSELERYEQSSCNRLRLAYYHVKCGPRMLRVTNVYLTNKFKSSAILWPIFFSCVFSMELSLDPNTAGACPTGPSRTCLRPLHHRRPSLSNNPRLRCRRLCRRSCGSECFPFAPGSHHHCCTAHTSWRQCCR